MSIRRWRRSGNRPTKYDLGWYTIPTDRPGSTNPAARAFGARATYHKAVMSKSARLAQVMAFQVMFFPNGKVPPALQPLADPAEAPWRAIVAIPGRDWLQTDWPTEILAKDHCQAFYDAAVLGKRLDLFVHPSLMR